MVHGGTCWQASILFSDQVISKQRKSLKSKALVSFEGANKGRDCGVTNLELEFAIQLFINSRKRLGFTVKGSGEVMGRVAH